MFGGVIDRKNITSELWSFDITSRKWALVTGENAEITVFKKVEVKICIFKITERSVRSSWAYSSRIWIANVCVLWIQPAIRFHALRPNL